MKSVLLHEQVHNILGKTAGQSNIISITTIHNRATIEEDSTIEENIIKLDLPFHMHQDMDYFEIWAKNINQFHRGDDKKMIMEYNKHNQSEECEVLKAQLICEIRNISEIKQNTTTCMMLLYDSEHVNMELRQNSHNR